jgi:hypothetical protein
LAEDASVLLALFEAEGSCRTDISTILNKCSKDVNRLALGGEGELFHNTIEHNIRSTKIIFSSIPKRPSQCLGNIVVKFSPALSRLHALLDVLGVRETFHRATQATKKQTKDVAPGPAAARTRNKQHLNAPRRMNAVGKFEAPYMLQIATGG